MKTLRTSFSSACVCVFAVAVLSGCEQPQSQADASSGKVDEVFVNPGEGTYHAKGCSARKADAVSYEKATIAEAGYRPCDLCQDTPEGRQKRATARATEDLNRLTPRPLTQEEAQALAQVATYPGGNISILSDAFKYNSTIVVSMFTDEDFKSKEAFERANRPGETERRMRKQADRQFAENAQYGAFSACQEAYRGRLATTEEQRRAVIVDCINRLGTRNFSVVFYSAEGMPTHAWP